MYTASVWQMVTGLITVFYYSFYIKNQASGAGHLSPIESMGVQSLFDNLYTFSITYGLFFVVVSSVNFIFTRRLVKDDTLQYKLPLFWIALAVIMFFLSDFISVMLFLAAAVIALSKNRPLKLKGLARTK
jgi:hypothetical protein